MRELISWLQAESGEWQPSTGGAPLSAETGIEEMQAALPSRYATSVTIEEIIPESETVD